MGVRNAANVLYSIKDLSFPQLHSIGLARAKEAGRVSEPCVAVDFSWISVRLKHNVTAAETSKRVNGLLTFFSNHGWKVIVVCDPPHRHHSKKATIVRNMKRERALLEAIRYKSNIMGITKTLRDPTITQAEKSELQSQRKELESNVAKCESELSRRLSAPEQEALFDSVCQLSEDNPMLSVIYTTL